MSISDSLAYGEDFTNAVDVIISENQKQVWLVIVQNDAIDINDNANLRVVSRTRITIADGYRSYVAKDNSPYDGYLYPRCLNTTPNQIKFLADGQLSSNSFIVGGICFPYTFGGVNYGLAPLQTFQPKIDGYNNLQVYIELFGFGFPLTTNYYVVKDILLSGVGIQEGISYKLLINAANVNLQD